MRKYDDEFKREAIRKVFDGQSVASVAREFGVAEGLIHNWKKRPVSPARITIIAFMKGVTT